MDLFISSLNAIDSFMWGPPLITLLVGTGIFLTIRLRMLQVFRLPKALKLIFCAENKGEGDVSSFKALCVALAATVGTGNIVGVATAVKVGGPGAIFWMWMAAFFGMATKYAKVCWLSNIVQSTKRAKLPVVRCSTSAMAWAKNISRSQRSLPLPRYSSPISVSELSRRSMPSSTASRSPLAYQKSPLISF